MGRIVCDRARYHDGEGVWRAHRGRARAAASKGANGDGSLGTAVPFSGSDLLRTTGKPIRAATNHVRWQARDRNRLAPPELR